MFKGPGVRYEVACCIKTGHIVWINGPFPCGAFPDIKIFRLVLKDLLLPNEKVEADNGYRGEPFCIRTPTVYETLEDLRKKKVVRARQETVNKRFKQWNCLAEVYRHDLTKHEKVFGAVAVLCQLMIKFEDPVFQVDY